MNQWKSAHAVDTKARTLSEALVGADRVARAFRQGRGHRRHGEDHGQGADHLRHGQSRSRNHAGRSEGRPARRHRRHRAARDYPNQVNNVLGFPYIFRGALDVRARTINEAMKIAAAEALAALAREDVPDEVAAAYSGGRPSYGADYIIPARRSIRG